MDSHLIPNKLTVSEAKKLSLTDLILSRMFLMEDALTISEEDMYDEQIQLLAKVYTEIDGRNAGHLYLEFLYCLINKSNLQWIWDKENIHWGEQWTLKRIHHVAEYYYSKLEEYPQALKKFQLTLFDIMKKSKHNSTEYSWQSIYNEGFIPYLDKESVEKWIYIFDKIDSNWKKDAYDNYEIWIRGDNEPPEPTR